MKLIIDTRNGLAGDIFCAGLIGLGATSVVPSMRRAAGLLGKATVDAMREDTVWRMSIQLTKNDPHLHEHEAFRLLTSALQGHSPLYQEKARAILTVLCNAERYVHAHHPLLKSHGEAVLHEAQDILIDTMGVISGLEEMGITEVLYLGYLNVGNGTVTFSHGTFPVPAPATEHILKEQGFVWQKSSQHNREMMTPTAVSILAGLQASKIESLPKIYRKTEARGTYPGLPAISFMLTD